MVSKLELAGVVGFGLFIGGFLGFVLSKGDVMMLGVGAVVLTVLGLIWAFTMGNADGQIPPGTSSH